MSAGNEQYNHLRALILNRKVIDASYTVRVGSASDDFAIDNPLILTDPAADVTITVPDGIVEGQELYIEFSSNTDSKTLTLTTTTGDDESSSTATDFICLKWCGTSGWQTIWYEVD